MHSLSDFSNCLGMKYYNFNNALIVVLTGELAILCAIENITINEQPYQKLHSDFIVVSRHFKNVPNAYIPISKNQAIALYYRLRAQSSIYVYAYELWEAIRKKRKIQVSSSVIMNSVLISMTERELGVYPQYHNKPYFWRKTLPNEN